MVELADLSVLQYPGGDDGEGPTPGFAVIFQLGGGKTKKAQSKTFFMGAYERRWSAAPIRLRATNMPHQSSRVPFSRND